MMTMRFRRTDGKCRRCGLILKRCAGLDSNSTDVSRAALSTIFDIPQSAALEW